MRVKIKSKENIAIEVANIFINQVNENPKSVLGFATGSTPLGVYAKLIEAYNNGLVSFKQVTSFNLDEYVGLDGTHEQSYRYFMDHNLFDHIDIDKAKTHVPSGVGDDIVAQAQAYDVAIEEAGGIDLQILGLGSDGHIAFNEPGTPFKSLTHVAKLAESTIKDNSRFFESLSDVPKEAVTMGLESIMRAKKIVLIATGASKADAVRDLLLGVYTEKVPATVLRTHPDVTIYLDKEAASKISE